MRPFGRRKRGSMLNRTDVRRECHKITFNRGEELQQKGAVRRLNWEKKKEDGFDVVQMVSGSGENLYEVKVKVDEDYREILEYECECPAFYSYSGMCKHCVAVLLDYLEKREETRKRGKTLADYGISTGSSASGGRGRYPLPVPFRQRGWKAAAPASDLNGCWSAMCSGTG